MVLSIDGVRADAIAKKFGTPTYAYSATTILRNIKELDLGFGSRQHLICYAVKANSNLALLQLLQTTGCAFDAVSGGELARLSKIGVSGASIIFSGVGKTDAEIAQALDNEVLYIAAESADEVSAIAGIAQQMKRKARVTLRINPNVKAPTHRHIATGTRSDKFGMTPDVALQLAHQLKNNSWVSLVGISCHIGSQILRLGPFRRSAKIMRHLALTLKNGGHSLRYLSMGGGLGLPTQQRKSPRRLDYTQLFSEQLGDLGLTLVIEPGRSIVGDAGWLISRVVRTKQTGVRRFVILDAGMNDLLRPALYGAEHSIVAAQPIRSRRRAHIVGPVCESADQFLSSSFLGGLRTGDLVALTDVGAYGFTMSSNYNARPLAAEVLCHRGHMQQIRRRQDIADMWRDEYPLRQTHVGPKRKLSRSEQ